MEGGGFGGEGGCCRDLLVIVSLCLVAVFDIGGRTVLNWDWNEVGMRVHTGRYSGLMISKLALPTMRISSNPNQSRKYIPFHTDRLNKALVACILTVQWTDVVGLRHAIRETKFAEIRGLCNLFLSA